MKNLIAVNVLNKTREAEGIYSFELAREDGQPLPPFTAGAHIDIATPDGAIRQYSLCNNPEDSSHYLVGIMRDPESRGGSRSMVDEVKVGTTLQISEPRNHFPLVHADRTILFAGGIGVTPILCMAERLQATGADFEFHYCVRSQDRAAFHERMRNSSFASRVHLHLDDGPEDQKLALDQIIANPSTTTHLYVCGPTGFMNWIIDTAKAKGWSNDHIHREYFSAEEVDTSDDGSYTLKIASTGQLLTVEKDQKATDVLNEAGFAVDVSCEEGICGTCITRVLSGDIEHRDLFLMDSEKEENSQFTPCVSRGKPGTTVVLDL